MITAHHFACHKHHFGASQVTTFYKYSRDRHSTGLLGGGPGKQPYHHIPPPLPSYSPEPGVVFVPSLTQAGLDFYHGVFAVTGRSPSMPWEVVAFPGAPGRCFPRFFTGPSLVVHPVVATQRFFGIFTPKIREDESNLTSIFFSDGLVQPPSSCTFYRMLNYVKLLSYKEQYGYGSGIFAVNGSGFGIQKKHELKVWSPFCFLIRFERGKNHHPYKRLLWKISEWTHGVNLQSWQQLTRHFGFPNFIFFVFENRGTPKSFILIGFSILKPSILGYPYFLETPIWWIIGESSAFLLGKKNLRRWRLVCCAHSVGADSESLFNLRCLGCPKW